MKQKLMMISMMQRFAKIAGLQKIMPAATIMLLAVFAAQAATFTVTNTNDSGAGSLRDAIAQANASAANDAITFAPAANGTITLLSALPNLANNGGTLTITGNGAADTIISGNNSSNRIFTSFSNVTINRLTLRDSDGGAIINYNLTLTLNDVVITNNISNANGSAITIVGGNLNLNRVTVTNNNGPNGTGIYVQSGNLNVTDSTFSGNSGGTGDVIRMNPSSTGMTSTLTMVNSTISGNSATFNNAGITLQPGSNAANITIANLTNCTITNNSTTGQHGAIWLQPGVGTRVLNLRNTIVSGNTVGGVPFDIEGAAEASSSFNLIGTGGGLTNGVNSNIVGVNDPQLLPLADNGGTTLTHALLVNSPALDEGFNFGISASDQRGNRYQRTFDYPAIAPASGGDNTDIGAVEQRAYTVTKTADTDDGVCDTDCSLREAITAANANTFNDTITFAPAANGTITLLSALPNLANNGGTLTITGNGAADTIISGNGLAARMITSFNSNLTINALTFCGGGGGVIIHYAPVTLNDVVLRNNNTPSNGVIANVGSTLNLNRVTIANNTGGNVTGVYVQGGNLNVTDSTFSGNSGSDVIRINSTGGGVSTLTMVNSTISGNTATFNNAGITLQTGGNAANVTVASLTNVTITNNSTTGQHGAIWLQPGPGTNVLNLRNTIVSGNRSGGAPFDIDGAASPTSSFNLIGTGGGLTNGVNSNIVGVNDPQLLPLADNGGTTLTHAPLYISPALDAGRNFNVSTTDQRGAGFTRTVDLGALNVFDGTDIGAFEAQIEPDSTAPVIAPTVSGTLGNNGWYTSNVQVSWSVIDDESTVTDQTGCAVQTVSADTNGVTFTCSATSAGGSSSQSVTIKRDATAPTISFTSRTPPNANGWNNSNVTVNWSCSDALSGAVNPNFSQTITTEGVNQLSTGTCVDNAGNSASTTQNGINIDKTAPTLAPTVTPNPVLSGGTATAAANATDGLSGIASQSCPGVDTSTVGTKSLTCMATDLAGNTNTASVSYQVNSRFNFTGFFQPVDNLPMVNVAVAGSSIPLKFSLSGNLGLNIFAAGYPVSTPVACDANEPGSTIDETVNAGASSLSYNATTDQYTYVWKTNKAWSGTCRMFVLKLSDGSEYYAKFRFR